jgi:DNA-binding response OmpR family regulator
MKVIIVEDEKVIVDAINVAFEFRWPGVNILSAGNGREGIELIRNEHPDVVILDINLPDTNGFIVLKEVRTFSSVPIIILTVRADDTDVLKGLEAGADDYIIKPFNYLTLLARIKAVLRRSENITLNNTQDTIVSSRLKVDFVNQKVILDNKPVKLTPVEYRVLISLIKNKDNIVTYKNMMEDIWGSKYRGDTKNIRLYIRRLRGKLNDNPPSMIINQRDSGYIFKG